MHRLSGVIELTDGYTGRPAVGVVPRFRVDGVPAGLSAKSRARYVMANLGLGRHRVDVDAPPFLPSRLDFELELRTTLADAWFRCVLVPGPAYTYPPRTTLIRGVLAATAATGISAHYTTARGRPRRVSTQGDADGAYTLALTGQLIDPTPVTLRFAFADGDTRTLQLTVTPGSAHRAAAPI